MLGVVDQIGDVTFYSADQLKLEQNQFTPVFHGLEKADQTSPKTEEENS